MEVEVSEFLMSIMAYLACPIRILDGIFPQNEQQKREGADRAQSNQGLRVGDAAIDVVGEGPRDKRAGVARDHEHGYQVVDDQREGQMPNQVRTPRNYRNIHCPQDGQDHVSY